MLISKRSFSLLLKTDAAALKSAVLVVANDEHVELCSAIEQRAMARFIRAHEKNVNETGRSAVLPTRRTTTARPLTCRLATIVAISVNITGSAIKPNTIGSVALAKHSGGHSTNFVKLNQKRGFELVLAHGLGVCELIQERHQADSREPRPLAQHPCVLLAHHGRCASGLLTSLETDDYRQWNVRPLSCNVSCRCSSAAGYLWSASNTL